MAQWDNQKLVSHRSRVRLQAVLDFLYFIKNLIKDKSKHKKKNVTITIYIVLSGPLTVMYNMYKSMTS